MGGMVQNVSNMGNRQFASIRGNMLAVKPNILEDISNKYGVGVSYLVAMGS